jgi:PEGA domain
MNQWPNPCHSILLAAIIIATSPAPAAAQTAQPAPAPAPAKSEAKPEPKAEAKPEAPSDPKPDPREQARLHFEQGVALYKEANYAAALAEFEAANKASPAPAVLYNIGLSYKGLFRYPESIAALNRYLDEGQSDPRLTAERRTEIEQSIAEMRSLLAPVTFALEPKAARVLVDGRELAIPEDGVVQLAAGRHIAELSAEHHNPERREFTVAAGTPQTLTVKLKAIPRSGMVFITSSQPNTRLKLDGKELGFAPMKLELGVGGHQLEATVPKYEIFQTEVMISPGQSRNIDIEMRLPPVQPLYRKWYFWTAVGTAIAGGTVTAILLQPGTAKPTVGGFGASSLKQQ